MIHRAARAWLMSLSFALLLVAPTMAKADFSFIPVNCNQEQIDMITRFGNEAIALLQRPKSQAQFERWFGPATSEKAFIVANVEQFTLETLQITFLGAAARAALGLNLSAAQWLRIDCSGQRQETLGRQGGADLIILDRPFFERKTDAELATFDSHAGTIVHEITHLGGIGHLPGCSGSLTAAQCFDFALERAAADDPAVLNSAHNYEYLFVNK